MSSQVGGGDAGYIIVGIIVAVLIHALNILPGAFTPTIHSLRLHSVEFFCLFYEGGGRPCIMNRLLQVSRTGSTYATHRPIRDDLAS